MRDILILLGVLFTGMMLGLIIAPSKYVPQLRSPYCKELNKPCIIQCASSGFIHNGPQVIMYDYYAPTTLHWSGKVSKFEFWDITQEKNITLDSVTWEMNQYKCVRVGKDK